MLGGLQERKEGAERSASGKEGTRKMAKRAIVRTPTVRLVAPTVAAPHAAPLARRPRFSAALAKAKARASAAAARARRVAYEERHQLTAVAAAAAVGLVRRFAPDLFSRLSIGPLGSEAVLGIGGFIAQRMGVRNEWIRHGTTAMLAVAAYNMAAGTGVSGAVDIVALPAPPEVSGEDEAVEGEV